MPQHSTPLPPAGRDTTDETLRGVLSAVLAGVREAIALVDAGGRVVLCNAAFESLHLGDRHPPALFDGTGALLPPEAMPQQRASRGETADLLLTHVSQDGAARAIAVTVRPMQSIRVLGTVGIVTVRDPAGQEPAPPGGDVIVLPKHDLITALSGLHGYTDLLAHTLGDDLASDLARLTVQRIFRISNRLIAMVREAEGMTQRSESRAGSASASEDVLGIVMGAVEIGRVPPGGA
jgi:hypothetical protein